MMTDPIADMLTRLRNASAVEKPVAEMPASSLKVDIAKVLKEEGFILDYSLGKYIKRDGHTEFSEEGIDLSQAKVILRVYLKYGPDGEKVIRNITRGSKPGRRYYKATTQLNRVLDGLGIAVLSTSSGVMSDRIARKKGVGGEVICTVW
jgi:small subunit ribosomal protein S8